MTEENTTKQCTQDYSYDEDEDEEEYYETLAHMYGTVMASMDRARQHRNIFRRNSESTDDKQFDYDEPKQTDNLSTSTASSDGSSGRSHPFCRSESDGVLNIGDMALAHVGRGRGTTFSTISQGFAVRIQQTWKSLRGNNSTNNGLRYPTEARQPC